MGMSARMHGASLWMIGPVTSAFRVPFAGTESEMWAEIARLHRLTGKQHSAREV
jgi:hypothetical protein